VLPSIAPVPRPAPAPKAPAPPPTLDKVVRTLGHGWKLLLAGGPTMILRAIALWALFMSPLFFALRRRVLRRLDGMAP
jgi:hypothetical protein